MSEQKNWFVQHAQQGHEQDITLPKVASYDMTNWKGGWIGGEFLPFYQRMGSFGTNEVLLKWFLNMLYCLAISIQISLWRHFILFKTPL